MNAGFSWYKTCITCPCVIDACNLLDCIRQPSRTNSLPGIRPLADPRWGRDQLQRGTWDLAGEAVSCTAYQNMAIRTWLSEAKIGWMHGLQGAELTGWPSQSLAHWRNRIRQPTKSKGAGWGKMTGWRSQGLAHKRNRIKQQPESKAAELGA